MHFHAKTKCVAYKFYVIGGNDGAEAQLNGGVQTSLKVKFGKNGNIDLETEWWFCIGI